MFSQSLYFVLSVAAYLICLKYDADIVWHIAIQGAMFLFLVVSLFFSFIGGEQAATVASLDRLGSAKAGLARLLLKAGKQAYFAELVESLERNNEQCRYISPVDSEEARNLDDTIVNNVEWLERIIDSTLDAQSWSLASSETKKFIASLELSIAERKLLRN